MSGFLHDLRYGARLLFQAPGLVLAAVLLLGLGLGVNTTIFSLVNAALLRPLPEIAEPERLVTVGRTQEGRGFDTTSYPNYRDYRDQNTVLSGLLAYSSRPFSLSSEGQTDRVIGQKVSGNYFEILGVKPAIGRFFGRDEDSVPGRDRVAVISHQLWQRRWSGDPAVVGRQVTINSLPFTVIGVAPEWFVGCRVDETPGLWAPVLADAVPGGSFEQRDWVGYMLVGRLRPGVSRERAQDNLGALARSLEEMYPRENQGKGVRVEPFTALGHPDSVRATTAFLGILWALTAIVLLVACANVANLLLARASARGREISIRLAVGASRARLIRQLLVEGTLLSLLGAGASLALAVWSGDALLRFLPAMEGNPVILDLRPDLPVILYTFCLALLCGLIFGLAPALHASRPDLLPILKAGETTASPRRSHLRYSLTVLQVALCVVLLAAGGLLGRSLQGLHSIDPRMRIENVLLFAVNPALNGYSEAASRQLFEQLLPRIESLPGVEAVTAARMVPFSGGGMDRRVIGGAIAEPGLKSDSNVIVPGYFRATGIPLVRGRDFTPADREDAPRVAIVNQTLAKHLWPNEDAIGKAFGFSGAEESWQIVGIARDSHARSATEETRPFFYMPLAQRFLPDLTIHVNTAGPPLGLLAPARRVVRELDSNLPVYNVRTLNAHLDNSFWQYRMAATLAGFFSFLTIAMAAVGLYAVVAYHVAQRTREIGLRIALGASASCILANALRYGMTLAVSGLVLGVMLALAVTRTLASLLYGVTAADALTFIGVAALLLATTLLASYVPARRATKVDPMTALRHE